MSALRKPILPSVRKAILRALRKLKLKDDKSPVIVVDVSADVGYKLPTDFDDEAFAGLELLLLLESENKLIRVLTFWGSEAFFRASRVRLEKALSLDFSGMKEYYVTEGRQRVSTPRFWATIGLWIAALAAAATICANVDQLWKAAVGIYAGLFATAKTEFVLSQEPLIQAIEEEKKTFDVECRNLGSFPCEFTLLPVSPEPQDKSLFLSNSRRRFPPIAVGATQSFSISVIPKGKGIHKFTLCGLKKARWFFGERRTRPKVVSIDVWPAIDTSPNVRFEQQYGDGTLATVVVTAKHGRAPSTGIMYQATLSPAKDVVIVRVEPGNPEIQPPGSDSATATWHSYKLAAFTSQIYRLVLQSTNPKNDEEWKTVASNITVGVEANNSGTDSP